MLTLRRIAVLVVAAVLAGPLLRAQDAKPAPQPPTSSDPSPAPQKGSETASDSAPTHQTGEKDKDSKTLKLEGNEIVAPTLDADGNPIMLEKCARKDKACEKKRKELQKRKTTGLKITNGTLTVDGWTGKARLAYDISEVKFLYLSAPEIGTVIVGMQRFPGSSEQKAAFNDKTLTVTTPEGHTLQLSSDKPLLGNKKPESAWVLLDPAYIQSPRYPEFGYGSTAHSPYNWPGSRPLTDDEKKAISKAPSLPKGMETKQMTLPCQKVAAGEQPRPVKINGVMMTPPACPQTEQKATNP